MELILKQDEIEKALVQYLARRGFNVDPRTIEINMIGGRAGSGHRAEITIPDIDDDDLPQYTPHAEVPIAATPVPRGGLDQPLRDPKTKEPVEPEPVKKTVPKVDMEDPKVKAALARAAASAAEDDDEVAPPVPPVPFDLPAEETQLLAEAGSESAKADLAEEKPANSNKDELFDDEPAEPGTVAHKLQQRAQAKVSETITPKAPKSALFDD